MNFPKYHGHRLAMTLSNARSHTNKICFASDNYASIHPDLLRGSIMKLQSTDNRVNSSYGMDEKSLNCVDILNSFIGPTSKNATNAAPNIIWTLSGNASNALAAKSACSSLSAIITSPVSHMLLDSGGVIESTAGCRILAPSNEHALHKNLEYFIKNSKLSTSLLDEWWHSEVSDKVHLSPMGAPFFPNIRLLSLTQPTELGSYYTQEELTSICDWSRSKGLLVHMDGARLPALCAKKVGSSNISDYLGYMLLDGSLKQGVDLLSLGWTKSGAICVELLIALSERGQRAVSCSQTCPPSYVQKRHLQTISKQVFLSCQLEYLLTADPSSNWPAWCMNANEKAAYLHESLEHIDGIHTYYGGLNSLFVEFRESKEQHPSRAYSLDKLLPELRERFSFYVISSYENMKEKVAVTRWMTSWATTNEDVDLFRVFLDKHFAK